MQMCIRDMADDDHQRALVDDRLPVAEFRGDVHLDRDAQQLFKRVLRDDTDVVRRAAGDNADLRKALKLLCRERDVVEHDAPVPDARRDRIAPVSYTHLDVYKRQVCICDIRLL